AGPETVEAAAHAPHQRSVTGPHVLHPGAGTGRGDGRPEDAAARAVGTEPEVPLGVHDAGVGRVAPGRRWRPGEGRGVAVENFSRRARGPPDPGFRQPRERAGAARRSGVLVLVGRTLQPHRILDAFHRLVGADHPGPGLLVVLVFGGLPRARPLAQRGAADRPSARRLAVGPRRGTPCGAARRTP